VVGGANIESLIECQERALETYPVEVKVAGEYMRDPKWRPLNAEEKARALRDRDVQYWSHQGGCYYSVAYWAKPDSGVCEEIDGDE